MKGVSTHLSNSLMTEYSSRDKRDNAEPTITNRGVDDPAAADPSVPVDDSRQVGSGERALAVAPWQGLLLASVASIAVWGTLEVIMPVFRLPEHLQNLGNDATAAKLQEHREALRAVSHEECYSINRAAGVHFGVGVSRC